MDRRTEDEQPLRLLLIEDNPGDARLIEERLDDALDEAFSLAVEDRLDAGLQRLDTDPPHLVLLDLNLPDAAGLEAVRRVGASGDPGAIVVLTGLDDQEVALEALREGAQDYLLKDELDAEGLRRAVRYSLERERAEAAVERALARARRSELRWATVFEVAPIGIAVTQAETGEILSINRSLAETLGYAPDELTGRTLGELGLWEDPGCSEELVGRVLAGEDVRGEQVQIRTRTGETRHVKVAIRRLGMGDEEHLLWAQWDVTGEVERERELERRTEALVERAKEQSCLYDVSRILHDDEHALDERLARVVERIPEGWQHPELTEARLDLPRGRYETDGFDADDPTLEAAVERNRETVGALHVSYRAPRPEDGGDPFLEEEQRLLDEIAHRLGVELGRQHERRRSRRLVDILENTSDFVGTATPDGRTLWINRPGRRMLGIPESADVGGTPIAEWSPDWAAEKIVDEGLPAARRDGVWEGETALLTREGEEVPVSQVVVAHRDPEGGVRYFSTIARDVTERREAARRLRQSEERYRALFADSPVPIMMSSPDGTILEANAAFRELFGYPEEELGQLSSEELWERPEDRRRFREALETEGQVKSFEMRARTRDGSRRIVELTASLLRTADQDGPVIVGIGRDVTEQHRLEEELRERALRDRLTGLGNRSMLEKRLENALERARRHDRCVGLIMLDIRRFKRVNDSLGHTAGDRVLEQVARRLEGAVRGEDTVVRWGGDEFLVLVEEPTEVSDLVVVGRRVEQALTMPIRVMGAELSIDVAAGGVLFGPPDHPEAVEVTRPADLVRHADRALARAKSSPGPQLHVRPPAETSGTGPSVLERENDLRRGLEAEEFEPFYQPIVHLETGEIRAFEPLVRWRHPERGLVSPASFIPLAEETGLIHELGRRVLRTACHQVAEWSRIEGVASDLRITPNVSSRQFESAELVEALREALAAAGLGPDRVFLEVTESAIMRATDRVDELRSLGVRLLVDDFGTGYSSLSYLRDLPVDGLKIDRSFVWEVDTSGPNAAIVETLLTLGRRLGLDVVAEGIETDAQLARLREIGCELGQGFHLGRPKPAEEVRLLLERPEPVGVGGG